MDASLPILDGSSGCIADCSTSRCDTLCSSSVTPNETGNPSPVNMNAFLRRLLGAKASPFWELVRESCRDGKPVNFSTIERAIRRLRIEAADEDLAPLHRFFELEAPNGLALSSFRELLYAHRLLSSSRSPMRHAATVHGSTVEHLETPSKQNASRSQAHTASTARGSGGTRSKTPTTTSPLPSTTRALPTQTNAASSQASPSLACSTQEGVLNESVAAAAANAFVSRFSYSPVIARATAPLLACSGGVDSQLETLQTKLRDLSRSQRGVAGVASPEHGMHDNEEVAREASQRAGLSNESLPSATEPAAWTQSESWAAVAWDSPASAPEGHFAG